MPELDEQSAIPFPVPPAPGPEGPLGWMQRAWRPVGSALAVGLALMLMAHVVNGKHGLSTWQQNRAKDQELQKEINDLAQTNARLKQHIEQLKNDPDAIEHEAREKLHYARPGEVIYTLPPEKPEQASAPTPAAR